MPTNDFLRSIALDTLGAEIPTADIAVGIEHVDRIVRDALDEPAELFLALADRLFGRPAFGQVAGDLGIADEFAGRTADRIDDHMRPEAGSILALAPAFPSNRPCFSAVASARAGTPAARSSSK